MLVHYSIVAAYKIVFVGRVGTSHPPPTVMSRNIVIIIIDTKMYICRPTAVIVQCLRTYHNIMYIQSNRTRVGTNKTNECGFRLLCTDIAHTHTFLI